MPLSSLSPVVLAVDVVVEPQARLAVQVVELPRPLVPNHQVQNGLK